MEKKFTFNLSLIKWILIYQTFLLKERNHICIPSKFILKNTDNRFFKVHRRKNRNPTI